MSFISRLLPVCILSAALCGTVVAQGHNHDHGHSHDHGHHHHHEAPHGGTLIVFGNEFAHLELVHDSKTGTMTGYVLDGEAIKGIRLKQQEIKVHLLPGRDMKTTSVVTLKAAGNALTGEKPGDTSQFEGQADALKNVKKFPVAIEKITIKGSQFDRVSSWFPEGNHP